MKLCIKSRTIHVILNRILSRMSDKAIVHVTINNLYNNVLAYDEIVIRAVVMAVYHPS